MKERLAELRKTLNLSMEEFGSKVGVTRSTISRLESGSNNFTEQMIKSICREFNVDYIWLTTGIGDMFSDTESDYAALIDRQMAGENDFAKNVFKVFSKFEEKDWEALQHMIDLYSQASKKEPD